MNNELATRPALDQTIEKALIQGDLKDLTPEGRISFYNALCNSLGLNPLTQPFQYIVLNGKLQLYAKKDCTEQLRKVHGVSITSVDPKQIGELLVVVAAAKDRDGRVDSSTGAVSIGNLKGENLANAMMKAETKAKRRVTLSLCGLGMLDETEVDTLKEQGVAAEPSGNKWEAPQNSSIPPDYEPDLPSEASENVFEQPSSPPAKATAQPPTGRPAASQGASQAQDKGIFTLLPPENNTLICTVRGVTSKQTKPTDSKVKPKPYLVINVNGFLHPECDPDNPNISGIFCYDTKLFDAVKAGTGKQCLFKLDLTGKFVKLIDVLEIDGHEFSEGKPVVEAQ